jgi:hypothetical protein
MSRPQNSLKTTENGFQILKYVIEEVVQGQGFPQSLHSIAISPLQGAVSLTAMASSPTLTAHQSEAKVGRSGL